MTPRRPLSIALRLALLFSAIAVVILLGIGAYLYGTLSMQMHRRDDVDLLNKAAVLRYLLSDATSALAVQTAPGPVLGAVYGEGVLLRVDDAHGKVLVQYGAPPHGWSSLPAVPAVRQPRLNDIRDLATASGQARALTVMARTASGMQLRVSIARERSERLALLRRYAGDLIGALAAGAALATLLAFVIVRQGLRPLQRVADKANEINAHRLNDRLGVAGAPPELQALSTAFNAMLDRLEEGVSRLSGFAADLAHDMRTPVNTLMVETQVALSRPRPSEQYQALMASNLEEYERLARMIENTLFLARAENALLTLACEPLDAGAELARIRDYFEGLADEAGVTLRLDAPEPAPPLSAEPVLFQRAVSNLLSNAIAHTPQGGTVILSARAGAGQTLVEVANSGAGIPPERLDKIFDRYYRGDQARTVEGSSAGLGLSIVRAIMLLHGGQVVAESEQGAWTTFSLYFRWQAGAADRG